LILVLWRFIGPDSHILLREIFNFQFSISKQITMTKAQKIIIIILIVIFTPFFTTPAFAAQVNLDSDSQNIGIGEQFEVKLFLNTENEDINAVEGKIIFPETFLKIKEIRDGNSIINFWIERPKNQNGAIIFSGITPGGFNNEKGLILSAIFEARKEGVAKFEIDEARVLRNDGTGSEATLTITPFEVVVSKEIPAKIPMPPKVKDRERPESFVPEIAKDKTLFEGRWFVVFATQDKASGIGRYEIKETRSRIFGLFPKWISAESPYALRDQKLKSYIFVKAIDKAGNVRIEKILPRNPLRWYENSENWIIIIVVAFVLYLLRRVIKSKIKYQKLK